MLTFSAKIAYRSIKISAKNENDFGQDEIDIMEKMKMKMTNSLKIEDENSAISNP